MFILAMLMASPVMASNGKKLLSDCNNVIKYQLAKSATSSGANYSPRQI